MALIKPAPMDDIDESQLEVTPAKDAAAGVPGRGRLDGPRRPVDGRAPRDPEPAEAQPGRRVRLSRMRVAGPGPGAPAYGRVLRERGEGGRRGGDRAAGRPGVLRRALAGRPRVAHRLLARPAGPPHPPDGAPRGATHYTPIDWDDAFRLVGSTLRTLESPNEAIFYTSGRTSNEAAFLYQLFVRAFGTNNLPDCSNMCHESTSVALAEVTGIGKGSVSLDDVHEAELILVVGQNPGSNHPRMLSALETAKQRGATIIAVNPLAEAGLARFRNPQTPRGLSGVGTELADLHLPIRVCGDLALFQALGSLLVARGRRPGGRPAGHGARPGVHRRSTRPGSTAGPTTCARSTGMPSTSPPAWTAASSSRPPTCWPRRSAR